MLQNTRLIAKYLLSTPVFKPVSSSPGGSRCYYLPPPSLAPPIHLGIQASPTSTLRQALLTESF